MIVKFDHIEGFGKVSDVDFIYSAPYGILEENESAADALKQGWIPWDNVWYNLRSVRLNLKMYSPSKTTKRLSKKVTVKKGDIKSQEAVYLELYNQYCNHHGFQRNITWNLLDSCEVLEYYTDHLVGISLYKIYEDQFIAMQFIWNYSDPSLSLGTIAQMMECNEAINNNCAYVYLLGGYEKCCRYKATFKGFEFWTGSEWSTDVELYYRLVDKDEQIKLTLV